MDNEKVEKETIQEDEQQGTKEELNGSAVEKEEGQVDEINNDMDSKDEQIVLLKNEIEKLKADLEEKDNRYLRLQADLENFRRRARLDAEASEKYRAQSLISDLLPVIDNFERALQTKSENEEVNTLLKGMEMVYNNLLKALESEGAKQIEAVNKQFDPQYHEAVMQVDEDGFESNVVIEEMQKGYILKDRVIRPSMVKVNK